MPAFATLQPNNVLAKLAFDDVCSFFLSQRQNTQEHAYRRMHIDSRPEFDADVFRYQLRPRTEADADVSDTETFVSLSELHTKLEKERLGRHYTGHYLLSFDSEPLVPKRGYTFGKGSIGNEFDFLLCTKTFAGKFNIELQNPHAIISFYRENRGLYITSGPRSRCTELTLNGVSVQQHRHALNQNKMIIRFDRLEYTFQWTDYAQEDAFMKKRNRYVIEHLDGPTEVDVEMQTPLPNTRTIGRWTLGQALGAGTYGRVFRATSSQGQIAAIKILERTPYDYAIKNAEVQRCQELSEYAKEADTGERILRVIEVFDDDHQRIQSQSVFDQIAVVMQPITTQTFRDLCDQAQVSLFLKDGGPCGMKIETARVFREALLGLQDMHKGGWVHRDLKPSNIGVVGQPHRAVLLDLGTSEHIQQDGSIFPAEGCIGTLNYIAPEMERRNYNHSVDIWSMGVILYYLTYGYHPWEMAENPWSPSQNDNQLQETFNRLYMSAVQQMLNDHLSARENPIEGYIHPIYNQHSSQITNQMVNLQSLSVLL
ncbi:kinase-like domain-containing protein [Xylaria arbuscula]|nr:kinase-like domain-containing protein [Xylaria arbuscula]